MMHVMNEFKTMVKYVVEHQLLFFGHVHYENINLFQHCATKMICRREMQENAILTLEIHLLSLHHQERVEHQMTIFGQCYL